MHFYGLDSLPMNSSIYPRHPSKISHLYSTRTSPRSATLTTTTPVLRCSSRSSSRRRSRPRKARARFPVAPSSTSCSRSPASSVGWVRSRSAHILRIGLTARQVVMPSPLISFGHGPSSVRQQSSGTRVPCDAPQVRCRHASPSSQPCVASHPS